MRIVVMSLVVLAVVRCSCRPEPRPGDGCDGGDQCTDSQSALTCQNGVFVRSFCDAGCSGSGVCDYTNNAPGDPCVDVAVGTPSQELSLGNTSQCRNRETHATMDCTSSPCSGAASLTCGDGALREIPCRGPSGCLSDPRGIASGGYQCDNTLGAEGENCRFADEGKAACDGVDAGQLLECRRGKWTVRGTCTGPCNISATGTLTCPGLDVGRCFRPIDDRVTLGWYLDQPGVLHLEVRCTGELSDGGMVGSGCDVDALKNPGCQAFTCECPSGRKFDARLCNEGLCVDRAATCTEAINFLTQVGEC